LIHFIIAQLANCVRIIKSGKAGYTFWEDGIIIPETKTLAILMEMEIEASDVKREKIKMIKNQPKE